MRRNSTWRSFSLLWAVLQLALPALVLLADARLERDGAQAAGAHVESVASKGCRPAHPSDCALCQVLSRTAPPAAAPALPAIAAVVRPAVVALVARLATRPAATSALPRAPPAIA
jgi:hypothetical protein